MPSSSNTIRTDDRSIPKSSPALPVNPKIFDTAPLYELTELEFSVVNYDNTLYEFNDLDYSFVLEITEEIDVTEAFNYSSRRGISSNTLS